MRRLHGVGWSRWVPVDTATLPEPRTVSFRTFPTGLSRGPLLACPRAVGDTAGLLLTSVQQLRTDANACKSRGHSGPQPTVRTGRRRDRCVQSGHKALGGSGPVTTIQHPPTSREPVCRGQPDRVGHRGVSAHSEGPRPSSRLQGTAPDVLAASVSQLAGLDHGRAGGQPSTQRGREESVWVQKALGALQTCPPAAREKLQSCARGRQDFIWRQGR